MLRSAVSALLVISMVMGPALVGLVAPENDRAVGLERFIVTVLHADGECENDGGGGDQGDREECGEKGSNCCGGTGSGWFGRVKNWLARIGERVLVGVLVAMGRGAVCAQWPSAPGC